MASSDATRAQPAIRYNPAVGLVLPAALTALAIMLCLGLVVGYQLAYGDRVFPGVRVAGVAVGGRTSAEALSMVQARLGEYGASKLTVRQGRNSWQFSADDLGFRFDAEASMVAAMTVGRSGSILERSADQINAALSGHDVPPFLSFDAARATTTIGSPSRREADPSVITVLLSARPSLISTASPSTIPIPLPSPTG